MSILFKRFLILCGLVLFSSVSFVAAQEQIKGRVLNAETLQSIPNVHVIEGGGMEATVTDSKGSFKLDMGQLPITLAFSHIAYESRSVVITEKPDRSLEVLLIPKKTFIEEVVIRAAGLETYFQRENFFTSDYELWGNSIFILGYPDRVAAKMQLRVYQDGMVVASKEVSKKSELFKDAFGNIQLFGESTIDQLYFNGDSLRVLYSITRPDHEAELKSIVYMQDGWTIQKTEDENGLVNQYFLYNLRDSIRSLLHNSYDHQLFNSWQQAERYEFRSIPDVNFGPIGKSYEASFDPTDGFTGYAQDRLLTYVPVISKLFAWDDYWLIFENDGPRCTKYEHDGAFADSITIPMNDETKNYDFIQDELNGNIYITYIQNSQLTISKFNPETFDLVHTMSLQAHPYAEKVRIHQGLVYFLDFDLKNGGLMRLYSIPFKANRP